VTLRARWVTLRARWVTLRARWVTLRARWVTLRARWVTLGGAATTRGAVGGPQARGAAGRPLHVHQSAIDPPGATGRRAGGYCELSLRETSGRVRTRTPSLSLQFNLSQVDRSLSTETLATEAGALAPAWEVERVLACGSHLEVHAPEREKAP
jgi:hypothetical protein